MSIDTHINVTARVVSSGLTLQGFGLVSRVTYTDLFTERRRLFSQPSDLSTLGFAIGSHEYRFAVAVCSQTPRPKQFALVRGTRPPTISYTVDVTDVVNSHVYKLHVAGEGFTDTDIEVTADTDTSLAEINAALLTDLNAVPSKNYLAAFVAQSWADKTFTADASTDEIALSSAHNLQTGAGPFTVANSGGALPTPLAAATNYWFIRTGATTGKLATSLANALAGTAINLSSAGTGTQTMSATAALNPAGGFTVTGVDAGDYFSIESDESTFISVQMTHADPGIEDDLNDIKAVSNDWYYLTLAGASRATILAAAAWCEAEKFKFFSAITQDSEVENEDENNDDVATAVAAFSYRRTHLLYRRRPSQATEAGIAAKIGAVPVGQTTVAYQTIAGSSSDEFTDNQFANLDAKKASYYKTEAETPFVWKGALGSQTYKRWDVTVSLDFMIDLIQKRGLGLLLAVTNAGGKLGYVDGDIEMMRATLEGALDIGKSDAHKIVAPGTPGDPNDAPPTMTAPRAADVPAEVRAERDLPDMNANFRLQGAIETVDVNMTVTF